MTEDSGNLKPQRPRHTLARSIGGGLAVATGYVACKLIGINPKGWWPFMFLIVGGSFIGNVMGAFIAQKLASK